MTTDLIGLYVHIPFCKSKCAYCDFVSFGNALCEYEEKYVSALIDEISEYKREEKIGIDTIFFGGGTPSLLSPESLKKIMTAIRKVFEIFPDAEITVEANPKTLSEEKLVAYRELGINRISLGLQSIHEKELKILGRIHNFDEFLESYELCRRFGIANINVDLMYGIPEQTKESFRETLGKVIALSPEHISAYGLILEEGTRLYEMKDALTLPSEDEECEMYYLAAKMLYDAGYSHYEISNYSKEGKRSRHNLKYWHDSEYIGVGLAAHSYFGKKRYFNTSLFSEYFSPERKEYRQTEEISETDAAYEYAMMNLRLSDGLSLSDYERKFSRSFLLGREELIEEFIGGGYMTLADGRLSLTDSGFYVSNSILSSLL